MTSKASKEQGRSGRAGAESRQPGDPGGQPRQGSNRVERRRGTEEPKHHFGRGRAPSDQGEKEHPGPDAIAREQQGLAGRGGASGSHGAHGDRSESSSQSGEPAGEHTRRGRQKTPGNRSNR